MKSKLLNVLKYLGFLSIGVVIIWWIYRDIEIEELKTELKNIKYIWLVLSFLVGLLSHYSRAIRWNMLIKPLGYKAKISNLFMSIMIMYLTNLILPRAGEVSRCSVVAKYDKVPFTKLLGTVVAERASDVIALLFFATIILLSQISVFKEFLVTHPDSGDKVAKILSAGNIAIATGVIIALAILFVIFRRSFKETKFYKKIAELFNSFIEGIKAIAKVENKLAYIGHTVFIYIIWLVALYMIFFSFQPTEHLSLVVAMVVFIMGALGMIVPVQAGIGPFHFMVIETLFIYGIAKSDGRIFALIAHTSTNIVFLAIAGVLCLLILPVINTKLIDNKELRKGF